MADPPAVSSDVAVVPPPTNQEWRIGAAPANVPSVRHHLRAFAEAQGAGADVLSNLALATTEAVTNAVLHAYVDMDPGDVVVTAQTAAGEIVVGVLDDGRGMQPRPDSPGLGMGLPMIGQLTTSVDIRERANGGTEVRMRFAAPGVNGPAEPAPGDSRMQLLVDVARLAQSGGWPQQGVGRLVHLLVPAVADACALDRLAGDGLERLAAAGPSPPPDTDLPAGRDPRVLDLAPGGELAWWVEVALRDADRPIGLLRLGYTARRGRPRDDDLVFLDTLAERAARGLASAQLVADLRRTRRRVERILDALAEAVTVDDEDGNVVYANAAAVALLGATSLEEVLHAPSSELTGRFRITKEDGTAVGQDDFPGRRLLAGLDAPPLLTHSVRRDTGVGRWLLTKATVLDDGEKLAINIIEDVTDAKRAELRARFLAHAGEVLGSSLDSEETLRAVASLVVPQLADWCTVDLVDDDGVPRRVAVAHADPERLAFAKELERRYPPHEDVGEGLRAILDGGPPVLVAEITDEMLTATARDAEQLRLWQQVGMRSCVVLPLRVGDRTSGVLTMITAESARAFDADDLEFAEGIARRAAMAVENARLYSGRVG
jgi:GAF domain-containing protein/anti-sigma regulatory factor (Ser/Thr protein kinase)